MLPFFFHMPVAMPAKVHDEPSDLVVASDPIMTAPMMATAKEKIAAVDTEGPVAESRDW